MNKPQKFNAPVFQSLVDKFGHSNSYKSDNLCFKNKLKELCKSFSVVEPINEDWHSIWIVVPRGRIENFCSFEDAKEYYDVETYEKYTDLWKELFPHSEYWFKISVAEVRDYICVAVNNRIIFEYDTSRLEYNYTEEVDKKHAIPIIDAIIYGVNNSVTLLTEGKYNQYVKDNLPLIHRTGTILRRDFWKGFEHAKENTFDGISDSECEEFISLMKNFKKDAIPSARLTEMTANRFLKACSLGYTINGYEVSGLSPKEQYKKYADSRDAGLLEINPDDASEYETWRNNKNYSGHPWEVMRGGNSTHVDFFPRKDDKGYYFMLRGDNRKKEVALFYLALSRAGIPVGLHNGKLIADAFVGADKIGIVPNMVFPRYCHDMFPDEDIISFVNIYEDEMDAVKDYVTWQETPEIRLRKQRR